MFVLVFLKDHFLGRSLVVQGLRLCSPNAGGLGSISAQESRSQRRVCMGFPEGPVVKELLGNAGNTGSVPGLGDPRCHGAMKPVHHS